jgi:ankyrin repeat protein
MFGKEQFLMSAKGLVVCCIAVFTAMVCASASGADLQLVEAVKNKDREAVRALLKQHADVNAPQADGTTALDWAAHWDDLETAKLLIGAGANVNAATEYGVTALLLACTNESAAMVQTLVKAGANPNARLQRTGEIPLMRCARTGNADAVKALLDHGANVNAKESWRGQTALMWAAEANHLEAARALVDHGADVHARSAGGFTPLLFAARTGNVDLAAMLLAAGASPNESTPEDGSVLVVASASGHEALSQFLLDKGANPNVADGYGVTPLHFALRKGLFNLSAAEFTFSSLPPSNLPELAKALLAHGANPNARIEKNYPAHTRAPFRQTPAPSIVGATPFFLAAASGDVDLMRMLKAGGADPKLMLKDGTTPLMAAAGINRVQDFSEGDDKNALEAAELLVELGADVNAANQKGQTALHAAAFTGVDPIVQFLVEKGAKVDAKDRVGQTAWTIAEAISPVVNNQGSLRVHKSTADLLLKLGATQIDAEALRRVEKVYGVLDKPTQ